MLNDKKNKIIAIRLDKKLLEKFKTYVSDRGLTMSSFLRIYIIDNLKKAENNKKK